MKKTAILLMIFVLSGFFLILPARSQDDPDMDYVSVVMDNLVSQVTSLERAYNPSIASNIARTMRLDAYNNVYSELERYRGLVSGRTDLNSIKLWTLLEALNSLDIPDDSTLPVLEEIMVRAAVLECENGGIEPETVSQYILTGYSTFVMDHGDFSHPDFDMDSISNEDFIKIYFNGFGLMVLINMGLEDGTGVSEAIRLYESAPHLKSFLSNQFIVRGIDLDVHGLPLLETVFFDDELLPDVKEIYYGVIAEKIIIGDNIYGSNLIISDEWYSGIEPWVVDHILIEDRLAARESIGFPYGVNFGFPMPGPESLLGICGAQGNENIALMLSSDDFMTQIVGLEAMRMFDSQRWPEEASILYGLAEPLMASREFTPAMLALEVFDRDSRYTGEAYDAARRARIEANLPVMCELMRRADDVEWVDYIYSVSWWNIYEEGTLVDELEPCLPMIARVVNSDWSLKGSGEESYFPAHEVEVLTYFIPGHTEFFDETSEAVRGFLVDELDAGRINQFTVWDYVDYLKAASDGGVVLGDEWVGTILRIKQWAEEQTVLIREEELLRTIDELMW